MSKMKPVAQSKQLQRTMSVDQEGVSINQSLTTLGRIFAMLCNRKGPKLIKPPYRESKLTRILEDSLTYNSQMIMIVNVR